MADYTKPDYWALKAQKEGYPARSVYKLKEMDGKFGLLRGAGAAFSALDLGAAPGSFSLYILRTCAGSGGKSRLSRLTAADLSPLSRQYGRGLFEGENFTFIQGDVTCAGVREKILSLGPYSLILSDAAPATTGNRSLDSLRSLELAETALSYAAEGLSRGGNLAVKVFQGEGAGGLLKALREQFTTARTFKPQACRPGSFETYCIGLGKR